MNESEYERIESEIACDTSPVGIDAKKTHVLILSKLESIEKRLDAIEDGRAPIQQGTKEIALGGLAGATDAFDEEVSRLAERGVDVDARLRSTIGLVEKLTEPGVIDALEKIVQRMEAIEPLTEVATHANDVIAAGTDIFDEEIARCAERGIDVDSAMRNGIAAILYLGQRISTSELESLGTLLRSDVLHPSAVDVVGRMGCALVAAANAPRGSVGPVGAFSKLGDRDAKRSTAFLLEFAKQFGAALDGNGTDCNTHTNGGMSHG